MWNKFATWALVFLIVQQLIVASSTFWISHLSEAVVTGKNIALYLTLFVSSLFIVYIPGFFSAFNFEKAKSKAIYNYTQLFSKVHNCMPVLLSDKEFQAEREPWLTNESTKTIEETYHIIYDSTSIGLNTIFTITAICLAIDTRFLYGYFLCLIILPTASKFYKNKLAKIALDLQNDRKDLSQISLSGWDNIIIGNIYNFSQWWEAYKKRWISYNKSTVRNVVFNQLSSISSVMLSLFPVAFTFLWLFLHTTDLSKLAALIATLPRQIQIIQHLEVFTTYSMYWHGTYAKLKALIATLISPKIDNESYHNRINVNQIHYSIDKSTHQLASVPEFIKTLSTLKNGRVTIRGPNGSGKTTIVNLLKMELGEKAYYFPTNSRLLYECTLNDSFSTGQKVKICLEEIEKNMASNEILLLDEWDANLDIENLNLISNILDEIANKCCVVEISHRYNDARSSSFGNKLEFVTHEH